MYISSVLQSNGNSIEFSLSTWTRRRSKTPQSKFLYRNCRQRTWTIPVFLLQDLTSLSGIAIYFLFTICSILQVYCHLSMQGNSSKALKAPSRVEVPFLGTIVVLSLVARSRHYSYSIQPRNLYILRRREIITITITITTTIYISSAAI